MLLRAPDLSLAGSMCSSSKFSLLHLQHKMPSLDSGLKCDHCGPPASRQQPKPKLELKEENSMVSLDVYSWLVKGFFSKPLFLKKK